MKPKFRSLIAAFAPLSRGSLIVCVSLAAATSAHADRTWLGTTSTDWNISTNWNPATVPGTGDIAIFDATSTANLATTSTAAMSVKGVQVASPTAAVTIALPQVNKVTNAALTVDFATDTFTYAPGTPLATGDMVTLGGTMPTGLTFGLPYFVVNATATTFQVSLTQGGAAVDFTTAGTTVTATGGYNSLTMGTSGIDLSLATQSLTVSAPLLIPSSQSWNVATGMTLSGTGSVVGAGTITKSGIGNLLLANANNLPGGISVTGGQLAIRNGLALGLNTNTLTLANGTTFRIETTGNGTSGSSVFIGNPISVTASASVTMTATSASNGYSGLVTGDANSIFNIGAVGSTGQVSFSNNANAQQLGSFLGRVEIIDGGSIRFSATSGVNNGSAAAIWDTNTSGIITTRNTATVNLGSLVGSGTLSGSAGADGTCTFSIGGRNENCTFDGSIVSPTAARISAVTKVGTGTLTLTSATGLTYTGATNVNAGTLKINGIKSGVGSTTVKVDTTLAGTGSIAGTTTVQLDGILAPGDEGIGNLTFSNLTLNTGSKLNLQFGAGNDKATVSAGGTLTLQSGLKVDVSSFGTAGVYTIIDVTGATVSGTAATAFTVLNPAASKIYTFANTGSAITMTISTSDPNNFWSVDGGGSWNTPVNWTKNPTIPNAISAIAKFGPGQAGLGGTFSSSFAVTLDGNKTVGLLSFDDDFGAAITIDPGTVTPGTLNIDDGAVAGNIVVVAGNHIVNAPISVDAQGVAVDIGKDSLTLNGVVSGSSAALTKTGGGTLTLTGNNTYSGGTILSAGVIKINSATSMGSTSAAATFSGGTLQLTASLTGITRSYQLTGANSANIDTNGNDFGYGGVITPVSGATGGITKSGAGTMTLSAVQTYTGATAVSAGTLVLSPTASINAAGVNAFAGGIFHVDGGSFTTTAGSSLTNGSDIVLNSGSATFAAVGTPSNTGDGCLVGVNGGTFTASSITIHRNYNAGAALPTTVPADTGFVVTNGTANVSGGVTIGTSNSSGSALVSGGSLTVGGQFTLGNITSGGRYCTLRVTGGSFTSTDATNGVVLCTHATTANSAAVLLNGGTSTIERFSFGDNDSAADSIGNLVLDGATAALYVGTGGVVVASPNAFTSTISLNQGTLGAKANWSSSLAMNLTSAVSGAVIFKAADAANAAHDITLSGVLSGVGTLDKTGAGTLTLGGANTYTGATSVTAGTLAVTGSLTGTNVTVAANATLGGNGNITGNVSIATGGHHALAVAATSAAQVKRTITGTLDMASGTTLDLSAAVAPAAGTYVLVTATSGFGTSPLPTVTGVSGTLAFNGNNLELTVTGGGFSSWASTHAGSQTPSQDFDNDGVSNGVEYFMNASTGFTANPGLVAGKVTWSNGGNIPSTDYGTQFVVQTSTDLVTWANVLAGNPNLSNTAGFVSYTPTGAGKSFVRLKVTPN